MEPECLSGKKQICWSLNPFLRSSEIPPSAKFPDALLLDPLIYPKTLMVLVLPPTHTLSCFRPLSCTTIFSTLGLNGILTPWANGGSTGKPSPH